MIRRLFFFFATTPGLLMLASCATVKQQEMTTEPANWAAQVQQRLQVSSWEIRGRLGVQTENDGGTLDIIWKQAEQDFTIRLIAPFGVANYLVQGNNESAEIRFPDGRTETVNSIDDIFASTLQIHLPVGAVKDWLRGLPAQGMSVEKISWNEQGLLSTIKQSGWNISMENYAGEKLLLPHAMYLSRDDNTELEVRLVLRQWLVDN